MSGLPSNSSTPAEGVRSSRKPKGEGHSRRAEILTAAERIFVEHGYEGATIRKIADEVGLSSTALYMHFSDKGEILQEICRQAFEQLLSSTRRITSQPQARPQDRLRDLLGAYVDFGFGHPNAYRLIYLTRPIEARDGAESAAQQLGPELFQSFVSVLEEVQAAGQLRNGDARQAATVIWAGVHGIVSLIITKPYFDWGERTVLPPLMIAALFAGLIEDS